jgi:type IV pilus assembly protein PilC
MNTEELSFFNLQLAGMLKAGLPLEGALKELSATMQQGSLRRQTERLLEDLTAGQPLSQAVEAAQLPAFYAQMLRLGARTEDLAGVLVLVADYYGRMHGLWTRLKGLLAYPLIVLVLALLLSMGLGYGIWHLYAEDGLNLDLSGSRRSARVTQTISLWLPPLLIGLMLLTALLISAVPRWRSALRWRLPGIKEASLAQVASSLALLLRAGLPLPEAVAFLQGLERDARLRRELGTWRQRLSEGAGKFADVAEGSRLLPPLWVWMITSAGEDVAEGLGRAAELYSRRAHYRYELCLYAALPLCVLALAVLILGQVLAGSQALLHLWFGME